jgi:hypothetical protein
VSYYQFPAVNKLKIIDASGEHIGAFQVAADQDLMHLAAGVYIHGVPNTATRMRINLYGAERYDVPLVSSDWVNISDSPGMESGNWIGNVRFDFGGFPLDANNTYQMKMETQNYTRNGSIHYIACVCDYGSSVSNRISSNDTAIYMTIAGAK